MNALDQVRGSWPDDVRERITRFTMNSSLWEREVVKHWYPELLDQYETAMRLDAAKPYVPPKLSAQAKARRRWATAQYDAKFPWPCLFCVTRQFRTERGRNVHHRSCYRNPDCGRYASGQTVPIMKGGRIVGECLNTPEARASFKSVGGALGLDGEPASGLRAVPRSTDAGEEA